MIADREDFAALAAEKKHERQGEMLPMARIVASAAPIMDRVTKSDDWNRYLTFLQGFLVRLSAQREVAVAKLASPAVWDTESLLKLKSDVLQAQAGIDWLSLAIALPKAIMEDAGGANSLIAEFEAKRESAGQPKS